MNHRVREHHHLHDVRGKSTPLDIQTAHEEEIIAAWKALSARGGTAPDYGVERSSLASPRKQMFAGRFPYQKIDSYSRGGTGGERKYDSRAAGDFHFRVAATGGRVHGDADLGQGDLNQPPSRLA